MGLARPISGGSTAAPPLPITFGANAVSTSAARFLWPGGSGGTSSASANPQCERLTSDTTFTSIQFDNTAAGTGTGGNHYTYELCTVDASDAVTATALALTLDAASRGGSATGSVTLTKGTRIAVRATPAGTVTSWANGVVSLGVGS